MRPKYTGLFQSNLREHTRVVRVANLNLSAKRLNLPVEKVRKKQYCTGQSG